MSTKYKIVFVVAPLVFLLDLLTKWIIRGSMMMGESIPVIRGYFDIVHVSNRGAAFGMLAGTDSSFRDPFFYIVSAVAIIVIIAILRNLDKSEKLMPLIFALILGGIAGNTLDRIRFGHVTDFLSVHIKDTIVDFVLLGRSFNFRLEWPAFNVADSAITLAMVLLVWSLFRPQKKFGKQQ